MVRNCMEVFVEHMLPKVLNKYPTICKCDKCRDDVKAIALNNLNPLYISTNIGNVYTKIKELDYQFTTDIVKELTKAIEKVKENPMHNI